MGSDLSRHKRHVLPEFHWRYAATGCDRKRIVCACLYCALAIFRMHRRPKLLQLDSACVCRHKFVLVG